LSVVVAALVATGAAAQSASGPQPAAGQPVTAYAAPPMAYHSAALSSADSTALAGAIAAVHEGDLSRAEQFRTQLSDPTAQQIVRWAEADAFGQRLGFLELDGARRDLAGWPRAGARQAAAERAMSDGVMDADRTINWFDGAPPQTAEGAIALASALQAKGRVPEAQALVKDWWRNHLFDADVQARMLARFGAWLDVSDHEKRLDTLLLGPQGPAVQQLLPLLPADYRQLAAACQALRANRYESTASLPASVANDPVLAFEAAHYLRMHNMETQGFALVRRFPASPADDEIADKLWLERRNYFNAALRARDWTTAYAAMTDHGFAGGEKLVEAEFFAGWVALTKMHDPAKAQPHFEALQKLSSTPITQGRADFWLGRTAEARGDAAAAQAAYLAGGKYITSFYGQLAAEKAGVKTITLPHDPIPTAADRDRFDARATVRAARMLSEIGEKDLFKVFVLATAETLPNAEETALLVDLARYANDQDLSMRVVRIGAQRGFILAERGYPIVSVPQSPGSAEPAFALSIARQESNFWPAARSNANARGVMQLEPATARHDAAQLGVPWSEASLYQAEYNMRLGAYELGKMVSLYGGSYVMAAGAYNAGPNRPTQWAQECGDPRGGTTDPLDFIECIPFTETRNYVMRTFETTEIYRARLNGGSAPLTAIEDLKRGAYGYTAPSAGTSYAGAGGPIGPVPAPAGAPAVVATSGAAPAPGGVVSMAPVGYVPDPKVYVDPPKPKPAVKPRERGIEIDCTAALSRHGRHRDRFAERNCPREVSTHSASKRNTSAKVHGEKASRGHASAASRPRSSTHALSQNRSHRRRS
jgi:soluble lytic murein transglycosylase